MDGSSRARSLHAGRQPPRRDWSFDQSSGHEEDFLHCAAHIPPWNFCAVRQILIKRRSALTAFIFLCILSIFQLAGSNVLTSTHGCEVAFSSTFDAPAECALHQQWVLQMFNLWFLALALLFAVTGLVSWHNLAVSQRCVYWMSAFSMGTSMCLEIYSGKDGYVHELNSDRLLSGILYILSLWPLSSPRRAENIVPATALVSGLFNAAHSKSYSMRAMPPRSLNCRL